MDKRGEPSSHLIQASCIWKSYLKGGQVSRYQQKCAVDKYIRFNYFLVPESSGWAGR